MLPRVSSRRSTADLGPHVLKSARRAGPRDPAKPVSGSPVRVRAFSFPGCCAFRQPTQLDNRARWQATFSASSGGRGNPLSRRDLGYAPAVTARVGYLQRSGLRWLVPRAPGPHHRRQARCRAQLPGFASAPMRHTVPGHACRGRIAAFAAAIMRGPVELIRTTPSRRDCSFVRATVSRWRSAAVVAIAAKFTAPLSAPGGREARPAGALP